MLLAMNMELDRHPHPELEGMDLYLVSIWKVWICSINGWIPCRIVGLNHLVQRMLLELEGMHLETALPFIIVGGMHLGLDHKELDKELGQPDLLILGQLWVLLRMLASGRTRSYTVTTPSCGVWIFD